MTLRLVSRSVVGGVAVALAVPATAVAAPQTPATVYVLAGHHNGSATLSMPASGTFDVRIVRPSRREGYTAFEVTNPSRPAFGYYVLVRGDGSMMSGQLGAGSAAVGGGFPIGTGSLPRTVDAGQVRLARGRYTLTLVTHELSAVSLVPASGGGRVVRLAASHRTTASDAAASYRDPAINDYEYRTLALKVPTHAHVALLLADETWTGVSTVSYVNACLGAATSNLGCSVDPLTLLEAPQPVVDPGDHGAAFLGTWVAPPSGPTTAAFYSAFSGQVTGQSFIAIALP